jgi:hypothetical protein
MGDDAGLTRRAMNIQSPDSPRQKIELLALTPPSLALRTREFCYLAQCRTLAPVQAPVLALALIS